MNVTKLVLLAGSILVIASTEAFAAADVGKIVEVYAHPDGPMALRLDNGLPNSNIEGNCGTTGNQWAGVAASDHASIKAAILLAKATGSDVTLVTLGRCVGGWIKVEAIQFR